MKRSRRFSPLARTPKALGVLAAVSVLAAGALTGAVPASANGALLVNPGFESGPWGWSSVTTDFNYQTVNNSPYPAAHAGTGKAVLGASGRYGMERISQRVTLAAGQGYALSFWTHIRRQPVEHVAFRQLEVTLSSGGVHQTVVTRTNKDWNTGYERISVPVPSQWVSSAPREMTISFTVTEDMYNQTPILIDDVSLDPMG
ncbi:hypothetical protein [Streptomyces xantholiticus]|uniref:hypothetical protein n=1 Tax=Streptomyces xantholiticus TaxID=68285 RepID=UPI001674C9F6|nr:hypothetical protein [Streptomyces xantholiticus]GGW67431.1 hypothetical protein GCM10010381_60480 [Streptomyces xantholiticus]